MQRTQNLGGKKIAFAIYKLFLKFVRILITSVIVMVILLSSYVINSINDLFRLILLKISNKLFNANKNQNLLAIFLFEVDLNLHISNKFIICV